ncbi:Rab-GAP TBC domain-containing protein [Psidium guajava]|nr:Rab-GAP TBC domain-containing protein [Psidium guajava]
MQKWARKHRIPLKTCSKLIFCIKVSHPEPNSRPSTSRDFGCMVKRFGAFRLEKHAFSRRRRRSRAAWPAARPPTGGRVRSMAAASEGVSEMGISEAVSLPGGRAATAWKVMRPGCRLRSSKRIRAFLGSEKEILWPLLASSLERWRNGVMGPIASHGKTWLREISNSSPPTSRWVNSSRQLGSARCLHFLVLYVHRRIVVLVLSSLNSKKIRALDRCVTD